MLPLPCLVSLPLLRTLQSYRVHFKLLEFELCTQKAQYLVRSGHRAWKAIKMRNILPDLVRTAGGGPEFSI
jgi:hypothetical protein